MDNGVDNIQIGLLVAGTVILVQAAVSFCAVVILGLNNVLRGKRPVLDGPFVGKRLDATIQAVAATVLIVIAVTR